MRTMDAEAPVLVRDYQPCDRGERIVTMLGRKQYYPRFGFSSEKARHLRSPFPPDAFMALELSDGALAGIHGAVRYPSEFGL